MRGRDEAPMFMLLTTVDRDVGLMLTLAITAGLAMVGRIMRLRVTTDRLELLAALRSVEVRAVALAAVRNPTPAGPLASRVAQVMVSRRMLLAEAIGRLEPVVLRPMAVGRPEPVGRLVRVTTTALVQLCETIVRRVAVAARFTAVRAVARVAVGATRRLT